MSKRALGRPGGSAAESKRAKLRHATSYIALPVHMRACLLGDNGDRAAAATRDRGRTSVDRSDSTTRARVGGEEDPAPGREEEEERDGEDNHHRAQELSQDQDTRERGNKPHTRAGIC